MATCWVTSFYTLSCICAFICLSVSTNQFQYPSCVIIDPSTDSCLDIFFRYFNGFPSVIGAGELIHHEWVQYLGKVYDYNDQSEAGCGIRQQPVTHADFTDVMWTRDGFSTCTQTDVSNFNLWWDAVCEGHCLEDDNCRRYPIFFGQHLWNNCSWDSDLEQPSYDIKLP